MLDKRPTKNPWRWGRRARIAVSVAIMVAVAVAVGAGYSCWLSGWQIVPAILAGASGWLLMWAAATAVFGRIYCSTACPLGTRQDIFSRLGHLRRGFFHSRARNTLRWTLVGVSVVAAALGITLIVGLLDPAAAFSRMVVWLGRPAIGAGAFSLGAGAVAFVTLAVVAAFSYRRGRLLCNTVCPVGTLLGGLSRTSLYHVDINTDKCVGCGLCTARCKAECIDPGAHTVDLSRCVVCFDCVAACPNSAITFRRGRHQLQIPMLEAVSPEASAFNTPETGGCDRRKFLAALLAVPATMLAGDTSRQPLQPLNAVYPPGARSNDFFMNRCTGCGACTAACPTGIIKPSAGQFGVRNALHPVLDFEVGACSYDCTACSAVCPTGALLPLTVGEKHRFVIGKARVEPSYCLEYEDGTSCGECARRCPRRAIAIEPTGDGRRLPRVDFDLCIGCGACSYVCPARPRAIVIEGEL